MFHVKTRKEARLICDCIRNNFPDSQPDFFVTGSEVLEFRYKVVWNYEFYPESIQDYVNVRFESVVC